MNRKLWIQKALTMCLLTAIVASYSMVALANAGQAVGELTVSGIASDTSFVTVNGEAAKSGRTISSSSTITTPEGMTAIVNFGKLGKVQFGPNTTFSLNADDIALGGSLTSGSITVLSAAKSVGVRTLDGEVVMVNAGETVNAASGAASKQTTPKAGGPAWWVWALVFGGAIGGIILATTSGGDSNFGSGATTVSPVR
jgi:hypothetical protein